MQIFLEPVEFIGVGRSDGGINNFRAAGICNYVTAVLLRIWSALDKKNMASDTIVTLASLSSKVFNQFDADAEAKKVRKLNIAYTFEVASRLRNTFEHRAKIDQDNFHKRLRKEIFRIDVENGEKIEWCLPVNNPEIHLHEVAELINSLKDYDWLSIYLISDFETTFFSDIKNVVSISEAEFTAIEFHENFMSYFSKLKFEFERPLDQGIERLHGRHPMNDWRVGIG